MAALKVHATTAVNKVTCLGIARTKRRQNAITVVKWDISQGIVHYRGKFYVTTAKEKGIYHAIVQKNQPEISEQTEHKEDQ